MFLYLHVLVPQIVVNLGSWAGGSDSVRKNVHSESTAPEFESLEPHTARHIISCLNPVLL